MWKRRIKLFLYQLYRIAVRRTIPGLLIFESNLGRNYSGNPRAIYEEMLRRGWDKEMQICWLFTEPQKQSVPGRVTLLQRESLPALMKMHRASIWVTDTRQPTYIVKNPNTYYMMTWHGTPLKKLALDLYDYLEAVVLQRTKNMSAGKTDGAEWDETDYTELKKILEKQRKQWLRDSAQWNCLLAQNETAAELFRGCFWYQGEILCEGYPRNDVLVQERQDRNCNLRQGNSQTVQNEKAGDGSGTTEHVTGDLQRSRAERKRVVLYAPTWREYESNGLCDSRFEPPIDFDQLYEVLKAEDTEMIIKYHYYVKDKPDFTKYGGVIRDSEKDIAELYPICDMMITDYSSTMFDYAVLRRPMVFFAYDLERYEEENGFYFDYGKLVPGPIVRTQEELFRVLKREFVFSDYAKKQKAFYERFAAADSGRAAEEAVNLLANHL